MQTGLCSKECFIIALIYGDRLVQAHPYFIISHRNVHRFLLVCTLIASKMLDDFYCRNTFYAKAGGLSGKKLNELELKLCFLLDFNLNVNTKQFSHYTDLLSGHLAKQPLPSPLVTSVPWQHGIRNTEHSLFLNPPFPVTKTEVYFPSPLAGVPDQTESPPLHLSPFLSYVPSYLHRGVCFTSSPVVNHPSLLPNLSFLLPTASVCEDMTWNTDVLVAPTSQYLPLLPPHLNYHVYPSIKRVSGASSDELGAAAAWFGLPSRAAQVQMV